MINTINMNKFITIYTIFYSHCNNIIIFIY